MIYLLNLSYSVFIVFLVGSISGCAAFEWTSPPYNDVLLVCQGDNVALTWTFTTGTDEKVIIVQWHFRRRGQPEQLAAVYAAGEFFVVPAFAGRLEFLPNAGLRLLRVSKAMLGIYTVGVSFKRQETALKSFRFVRITWPGLPVMTGGKLQVYFLPAVRDRDNASIWHVQLACGDFLDRGLPPASVYWMTPSGRRVNSDDVASNRSILQLPNPVTVGDYTCHLQLPRRDGTCNPSVPSPSMSAATLHVLWEDVLAAIERGRVLAIEQDNVRLLRENKLLREGVLPTAGCPAPGPNSCLKVKDFFPTSGVHDLYLSHSRTMRVFCNQDTDNGGWTVIQRRVDGKVSFNRNWTTYEEGFGDLEGEFWLGLSNIHYLTSSEKNSLRVDLTDWDGNTGYALYDSFYIDGPSDNYRLHVSGYSGTIGDGLHQKGTGYHDNMQFSTPDRDNDPDPLVKCAQTYQSGWWYNVCHGANPNGVYGKNVAEAKRITWYLWHKDTRAYKHTRMQIRPRTS